MRILLTLGSSSADVLLEHHHMDALGAIDGLGHVKVAGEAAQHVGVGMRQSRLLAQKRDHVAKRHDGALVEVGIHAHP